MDKEIVSGGPAEFMTLRDFYAAFVVVGLLLRKDVNPPSAQVLAETVFEIVDALILKGVGDNDYKH